MLNQVGLRCGAVFVVHGVLLAGAVTATAQVARADGEAIHVDYEAPGACPPQDRLEGEIQARTKLARFSAERDSARVFRVSVGEAPAGYEGELVSSTDGVEGDPRRVRDTQCTDVVSALALMIAIAVDPSASTAPVADLPIPAEEPPPPAPIAAAPAPQAPSPPRVATSNPPAWGWAAGLDTVALGGVAPDVSLGLQGFAETSRASGPTDVAAYRFALGYADNALAGGASRDATMRWMGGQLEACPVGALVRRTIRLLPCGDVALGAQQAKGNGAPHPRQVTQWASSIGLGGRAQWWPSGAVFLEAGARATMPLLRRTFVFESPREVVYQMPRIGWSATIGCGLHIL